MSQVDSENSITAPARPAGAIESGLAIQQREREKALRRLSRLREKASLEVDRLLAFLDQSDPYVMTELEEQQDPEPSLGWLSDGRASPFVEDLELDDSDDEDNGDGEPSLGSIERHPSCYGADGRSWTGDQAAWADGGTKDLEDEHDGAEPPEDDEPSLGWTTSGVLGDLNDREQDDCDREDDDPAEAKQQPPEMTPCD